MNKKIEEQLGTRVVTDCEIEYINLKKDGNIKAVVKNKKYKK